MLLLVGIVATVAVAGFVWVLMFNQPPASAGGVVEDPTTELRVVLGEEVVIVAAPGTAQPGTTIELRRVDPAASSDLPASMGQIVQLYEITVDGELVRPLRLEFQPSTGSDQLELRRRHDGVWAAYPFYEEGLYAVAWASDFSLFAWTEGAPDDSQQVADLQAKINWARQTFSSLPDYLLAPDSFTAAVATIWGRFTDWVTRTDLTDLYDQLYWTGFGYQESALEALDQAEQALDEGDLTLAEERYRLALRYYSLAESSFDGATQVFLGQIEAGIEVAEEIKEASQLAFEGVVSVAFGPQAAEGVSYVFMAADWYLTRMLEGTEEATRDLLVELFVKELVGNVPLEVLDGRTFVEYSQDVVGQSVYEASRQLWKGATDEQLKWVATEGIGILAESGATTLAQALADRFLVTATPPTELTTSEPPPTTTTSTQPPPTTTTTSTEPPAIEAVLPEELIELAHRGARVGVAVVDAQRIGDFLFVDLFLMKLSEPTSSVGFWPAASYDRIRVREGDLFAIDDHGNRYEPVWGQLPGSLPSFNLVPVGTAFVVGWEIEMPAAAPLVALEVDTGENIVSLPIRNGMPVVTDIQALGLPSAHNKAFSLVGDQVESGFLTMSVDRIERFMTPECFWNICPSDEDWAPHEILVAWHSVYNRDYNDLRWGTFGFGRGPALVDAIETRDGKIYEVETYIATDDWDLLFGPAVGCNDLRIDGRSVSAYDGIEAQTTSTWGQLLTLVPGSVVTRRYGWPPDMAVIYNREAEVMSQAVAIWAGTNRILLPAPLEELQVAAPPFARRCS